MSKFTFSGFSDEIDKNIILQFEHLNKIGISYFEPRFINERNIATLNDEEVIELKETMEKYGIKASSIGSPIGKISINDDFEEHMCQLKRVVKTAKMLGTKYIRVFSFFIPNGEEPEKYKDEVIRRLQAMADYAESEGVILLHENEKDIYGDVAKRCVDIFEGVKSPALKGVFDPANFIQCGQETYPEAYEMLKDYIVYFHIKDVDSKTGKIVPAGYGDGKIKEIVSELHKKGYEGFVSLEPHLGCFGGLAQLELGDEMLMLEKSDAEKFTLAYESMKKIIDEVTK